MQNADPLYQRGLLASSDNKSDIACTPGPRAILSSSDLANHDIIVLATSLDLQHTCDIEL